MRQLYSSKPRRWLASLLAPLVLLLGLTGTLQAQVHYVTSNGVSGTTGATDAYNRVDFDGVSNAFSKTNITPFPSHLALDVSNDRGFLYDGTSGSFSIKVFTLSTGAAITSFTISNPVVALEYNPTDGYIYYLTSNGSVALTDADALNRIKPDGNGGELLIKQVAEVPSLLALNTAANEAYVYNNLGSSATSRTLVTVKLNGTSSSITETLSSFPQTAGLDYDPSNDFIYYITASASGSTAEVGDALMRIKPSATAATDGAVVASSIGAAPQFLALDEGNSRAFFYEANNAAGRAIKSINLKTGDNAIFLNTSTTTVTAIEVASPGTVTTADAASITGTTATLGGSATRRDFDITERGVVYSSANQTPVVDDASGTTVNSNGSGPGAFTEGVTGLTSNTTYYVRAYAKSAAGTGYGDVKTFKTLVVNTAPVAKTDNVTVNEDSGATTIDVKANDTDAEGNTLTVTAVTQPASGGGVSLTSGVVNFTPTANFNGATSFTYTISDGSLTATATVNVTVTPVNDPPAVSAATFTLPENSANSTVVGTVSASDVENTTLTYSITAGNTGGAFAINSATGQLTVANSTALDFETKPSFALTVQASDGSLSGTNTITVNLTDIDEVRPTVVITSSAPNPTSISPISFTVTFSENVTGFVDGDVTVTNGSITGGTVSGTSPGTVYTFTVTPSGTGAVTVNVPANVAVDAAGNGNTAAPAYSLQYNAPTVVSVLRLDPSPAAAATLRFAVTFSTSVTGVTVSNFTPTTTDAVSGASVSSASGSGTTYTVTVNTGSGSGTLGLNVINGASLSPAVTNTPYTGGEVYTITKTLSAAPTLRIEGNGSTTNRGDVTAFVDVVQVLNGGSAVDNALQNLSFETNNVPAGGYAYQAQAEPWSFGTQTGISRNSLGGFGSTAPDGDAVAFLQNGGTNSRVSQNLAVPTGSYQVRFLTAQRTNNGTSDQVLNVYLVEGGTAIFLGSIQPSSSGAYETFTSGSFTVVAPAVTTTITSSAGTNGSTTSTTPIPFTVTFSRSVTGFTDTDVTVGNGSVSGFSGSGTTYTFNVTPNGAGAVTVNVPAGVAKDANNTSNTSAGQFSITYAPITVVSLTRNDASPTNAGSVSYILRLSDNVSDLGTGNFTVLMTGGVSGASVTSVVPYADRAGLRASAVPVSASQYLVTVNTGSGSGTVQLRLANSTGVTPTITGLPYDGEIYTIDKTRPTVSISSSAGNLTSTSPIPFTVTFSKNVTGFVAGDVTVTNGSITGGVSGTSPGMSYTFNVTPTAAGDVTVNVPANVAVDAVGNGNTAVTSAYSITYDPITVVSLTRNDASPTNASSVSYSLVLSGSVSNLTASNFTVLMTGSVSGASVTSVTPLVPLRAGQGVAINAVSASRFNITVNTGSGSGTVQLRLANSIGVTPTITGLPYDGEIYSIDKTAPTATLASSAGADGSTTSTTPLPFTVTFSESVTGFDASDLNVSNGMVSGFSGSGTSYSFSVTPTADGLVTVNVAANSATDAVGNGNDAASFSLQYTTGVTTWTGAFSTDWYTAGNWTNDVPSSTLDAIIPVVGSGRYPLITAGTAKAKNVILNSGATLTQTGGTLTIANDFVNRGTFTATGGTVNVNGSTAQHLGSSSTRTTFWNLTVGASTALLEGPVDVQRLLTLNGNLSTQGNTFTLLSTATLTAMVVNNGGSVIGTATVQRAIDPSVYAGTGYRHYSSPVVSTTVGDLATPGFTPVVDPRYNTDPATARPFPNVFGYNEARITGSNATTQDFANGYFSPQDLSSTLVRGRGYTVNISAAAKVALTGTLTTGTVPVGALSLGNQTNSGWQLLGNPYPAPLDWNLARTSLPTGVIDAVYVYKPSSLDEGTYQFYQNGFGTLPGGLIGAMQGFFVRVSQPVAAFSFQNAWRATSYSSPAFNRTTADTRPQVQLDLVSAKGTHEPAYVYFEAGATAGVDDHYDAAKLPNSTGLNLASVAAGQGLAVNGLPLSSAATVVPLTVGVPTTGTYSLQAAALLNLSSTDVYLHDAVTGQQINLRQQASYSFTASNAALITGRFSLHFGLLSPTATQGGLSAGSVSLYPNPAQRSVTLALPAVAGASQATLRLLNVLGQPVLTRTLALPAAGVQTTLDVQAVPRGVYVLRIQAGTSTLTKPLVVN